jgi:hypothetical protein
MFMPRRTTVGCLAVGVMIIAPLVRAQEAKQAAGALRPWKALK